MQIKTLSNRADLVSDGDVLVRIELPASANAASLKVDVDGRDVSSAFAPPAANTSGAVTGLVTGLKAGANVLTASVDGAARPR